MPSQSKLVTVGASYGALAAPDVTFTFDTNVIVLDAESGKAFFSFDGVNDHGHLDAVDQPLILPCKRVSVWLKQDGGASNVRVSGHSGA